MGLDMCVYKTRFQKEDLLEFGMDHLSHEGVSQRIFYWRKHYLLSNFLEYRYYQKEEADHGLTLLAESMLPSQTGLWAMTGCGVEELRLEDIEAIEKAAQEGKMPEGFDHDSRDHRNPIEKDLEFVGLAKEALKDGYRLWYTSIG